MNTQNANLLKIKVTYGYELNVPLVGGLLTTTLAKVNPSNAVYYNAGRIPIESVATVRLQSVAWQDSNGDAGGSGGGGTVPTGDAGNGQPPAGDGSGNGTGTGDGTGNAGGGAGTGGNPSNGGGSGGGSMRLRKTLAAPVLLRVHKFLLQLVLRQLKAC